MSKRFPCSAAAVLLVCGAWPLPAQTDEVANRLVVMIKAGSSVGAGIICGLDAGGAYIATAGHAGGALLTAGREIAGMLRSDKPPYGEAVSIDRILERFKRWGYPAGLGLPLPKLTMGGETNCHLQPSGEARCWSVDEAVSP